MFIKLQLIGFSFYIIIIFVFMAMVLMHVFLREYKVTF